MDDREDCWPGLPGELLRRWPEALAGLFGELATGGVPGLAPVLLVDGIEGIDALLLELLEGEGGIG